jgi:hypothetical protein
LKVLKNKKLWTMLALTAVLCLLASVAYAASGNTPGGGLSGINDGNAFINFIKSLAEKFTNSARSIIGFLVVVVFVWAGLLLLFGANDSSKIAQTKDYFKYAVGALVVVVVADKIVGFFMGLLS